MTNQLHKCYVCDQDYFQYELEVHFVIHHSKDCNQINLESLENSETEKLYKCQACKKSFSNKSEFETHKKLVGKRKKANSFLGLE